MSAQMSTAAFCLFGNGKADLCVSPDLATADAIEASANLLSVVASTVERIALALDCGKVVDVSEVWGAFYMTNIARAFVAAAERSDVDRNGGAVAGGNVQAGGAA